MITFTQYRAFESDDNYFYELLNGRLVKKSAPSPIHQIILQNLNRKIDAFVYEKKLGQILVAPVDVFLDDYNSPKPDLLYVSKKKKQLITPDGIMGPPDIVVEIISPSSIVRDRVEKMKLYQKYKIPEYWIIDPANQSVEVYTLDKENQYDASLHIVREGKAVSKVLEGFEMAIDATFFGE